VGVGQKAGFVAEPTVTTDREQKLIERYQALLEVSDTISHYRDTNELFRHLVGCLRRVIDFDFMGIGLYEPETDRMRIALLESKFPTPRGVGDSMPRKDLPAEWVMKNQKPMVIRTGPDNPYRAIDPMRRAAGIVIEYHFPLSTSLTQLGGMAVGFTSLVELDEAEINFMQKVANQVAVAIENALNFQQVKALQEKLAQEKLYLEEEIRDEFGFDEIVGGSSALKKVLEDVTTVAEADATVLILGETGTGKELIARALHQASRRKARTFVKLNCAAIPTGLLESELFGHEKGAFTGAIAQKIGRLELADGGTLFLDEVGDIPLELQPKLLRAIQEREFERLGSTRTIKVNVRFIAATNRDLAAMVAAKQFRSDLYYRLNVFPISIPPLRARTGDIPRLVRYFVSKYASRMDRQIETIPTETMRALERWSWPGNVRELENLMERSVILSRGPVLQVPLGELRSASVLEPVDGEVSLHEAERNHIVKALRDAKGRISGGDGAAARLGLKRTTLQSKIKKLNIERREYL
jgi:formate hydrogenlyase transcriptional activator